MSKTVFKKVTEIIEYTCDMCGDTCDDELDIGWRTMILTSRPEDQVLHFCGLRCMTDFYGDEDK